eukprot:CAMPEP_0119051170 /NCGR_PEP_ID=MMETSP1177-20130426/72878_1 /TAXON_ID=2985 /ORGANISM="Ochromonas sp, Strain CCMP1899" /LENGTH=427 /DNA_ID=CAMNT_0007030287 /DNA_START=518 /DNA_END=1801 /DNA_ORIENTATION=+
MQVMPRDCRDLTILEFFTKQLHGNESGVTARIAKVLTTVQLEAAHDRIIKSFSGGQQARLLLAAALILEPDILLLDEPTNNLDVNGIAHLTQLIQETDKTIIVISHDEDFLNTFSDNVLYLDVFSKKVEQYDGDYHTVKSDISKRIARENSDNARLQKDAQAKKDQANKFANKGGGMRKVAQKIRAVADEMESQTVNVRKEDVALKPFVIPFGACSGTLLEIGSISVHLGLSTSKNGQSGKTVLPLAGGKVTIDKNYKVQLKGPNGIGKTTFLEEIANGTAKGVKINKNATVGYYRQDFNTLDFDSTGIQSLEPFSNGKHSEQEIRSIAASFLLRGDILKQKVITLSEGQKGLLSLSCLMLQRPSIIILDEPTNHINFRHLPALAKAIKNFEGAVLIVSHDHEFINLVNIDHEIDLGFELKDAGLLK